MASITRRITSGGETRYDVRVRLGHQVRSKTFRRRNDADRWARRQETRKDLGDLVDPLAGAVTLVDYARRWLPTRDLRPTTRELYGHLLGRRIAPTFGSTPINRITTEAVRSWHADVTRDVSALQAAKAYRLLRAMLNTAMADGLIGPATRAASPAPVRNARQNGRWSSRPRCCASPGDRAPLRGARAARRHRRVCGSGSCSDCSADTSISAEATVRVEHQAIELFDGIGRISAPKTDVQAGSHHRHARRSSSSPWPSTSSGSPPTDR